MNYPDAVVVAVSLGAAVTDVARGKVYNALTFSAIALGLLAGLFLRQMSFWQSTTGLVGGYLVYLVPHKLGAMGKGDVKLMAAVGAWKGLPFVLFASFYILCIGSVLGLLVLAWRGTLFSSLQWVLATVVGSVVPWVKQPRNAAPQTPMPFAPAIFAGIAYAVYLEAVQGPFTFSSWI